MPRDAESKLKRATKRARRNVSATRTHRRQEKEREVKKGPRSKNKKKNNPHKQGKA